MIKYALECDDGHSFESWFQSNAAFDALKAAGHLTCALCGSQSVTKALMTPRVTMASKKETDKTPVAPQARDDKAIAELRRKVEETSDYVGDKFTSEARAMHLGDKPERPIYGEARLDQAKSLIEDGVPLMPLPFMPKKKLS
jgi:hypothetical protein